MFVVMFSYFAWLYNYIGFLTPEHVCIRYNHDSMCRLDVHVCWYTEQLTYVCKAAILKIQDGRFVVMFSLFYLVPLASLPPQMYV